MARGLYRFYLYFVSSILTAFSAVGLSTILGAELESTPLHVQYSGTYYTGGTYGVSPGDISTQQLALGGTLLVVAGALLGVHYWLIRRDVRSDPAGSASSNRAIALNFVELISVLVALATGAAALTALGQQNHGDMAFIAGTAIASALVFVLVELERRRAQPTAGAAIIFQRLQQSLTPFIILTTLGLSYWTSAINGTADAIATRLNLYDPCAYAHTYGYPCTESGFTPSPPSQWFAVALVSLGWLVYPLLARGDGRSAIRQVLRFLGLAFVTGVAVNGVFQLADLLFVKVSHEVILPYEFSQPVQFAGPLLFGLLGIVLYVLLIRADGAVSPLGRENTTSALLAVMAVVAAGPFWWGCGRVLGDLIEQAANDNFAPDGREWAAAFALVLSGVAYIPLALILARAAASRWVCWRPAPSQGWLEPP